MVYRAGVIGCGRIGFGFDKDPKRKYVSTHIGAYRSVNDVFLTAVSDLDKGKLEGCARRWGIDRYYTDFEEMLGKEGLDIVSIATPADTHYQILKRAVDFPLKAIFCEKPLAPNLREARMMVELCRKKGIILQVNHQRRFDPLHLNLKKAIASLKFGPVQQVSFYYTAGIMNTGSHMFDILRFFFGDAQWIEAFFSRNASHRKDDPNLDGLIQFKSGTRAAFQACDAKKFLIFEMDCLLSSARFVLKNSGLTLDFYKARESKLISGYKELIKAKSPLRTGYKRNSMVEAARHIIGCIKSGKDSVSSGADGYKSLEMILAALKSAGNSGKRVYLGQERKCQS